MPNTINYAEIFQQGIDNQIVQGATSGFMELNNGLVKYNGGKTVRIPKIFMDGLGNYDRATGFTSGDAGLVWESHPFTMDRGKSFSIDSQDVDESNFVITLANLLKEFNATKAIPEIDAYRYSTIAKKAIAGSQSLSTFNGANESAKTNILSKLYEDVMVVCNEGVDMSQIVIPMAYDVYTKFILNDQISKKLETTAFKQGNIELAVKSIDGMPIIPVSTNRMKTDYDFGNNGFTAKTTAQDINWLVCAREAVLGIMKADKVRVFEPAINQKADAYKVDVRIYHDLFIPDNKIKGIFANIKPSA